MQTIDSTNDLFGLATELVELTSRNIFLTGKAGTGKTTFLKYIREHCLKKMVVVAPTGVAAINAGGVTIHSFFQLPFSPFVPGSKGFGDNNVEVSDKHSLLSRLRLNSDRRKIMQELELLIVDEISMVRCDVLDAVDLVLRHIRHRHSEPFGGVQVLFIGDMFQLPPVVKEQEWNLLTEYYKSPYFFDALVLQDQPPLYIEFKKIYRQTEEKFIGLLNKVRNNRMDDEGFAVLNSRYKPDFFAGGSEGFILLTTHNEIARRMNATELEMLTGALYSYKASIEDDFPPNAYPAEEVLQLKVGAQVMFIKNDVEKGKRYFNGKIGKVLELDNEKIIVQCAGDDFKIEVKKESWDNVRYTLNTTTRQLDEDVLGTFSQFPLRLAWAITIHKSQGLTFEKAVIDAGEAFAPGQVYVALSRCTSLEGLVLHSKVNPNRFYTDDRIVRFSNSVLPFNEVQRELIQSKRKYQEKTIVSLFDFTKSINVVRELVKYLAEAQASFNSDSGLWAQTVLDKINSLQETALKFHVQLNRLFEENEIHDENSVLHERLNAATKYFLNELKQLIDFIIKSPVVTDSRIHAKEFNETVKELLTHLSNQQYLMEGFTEKFDMQAFHRRKKNFVLPSFNVNAYAASAEKKVELKHKALYYQLKKLRDSICEKKNLPIYLVASSKTLEEMATYLPGNLEELEEISGFGKIKVETYGKDFLDIISDYAAENKLASTIEQKKQKRKRKEPKELAATNPIDKVSSRTNTKAETFRLYEEGKTIAEIAAERKLAVSTIEGHFAGFVEMGLVKIDRLLSREKILIIEPAIKDQSGKTLSDVKNKLGDKASFSEIRLVMASLEYQSKSSSHIDH